MRVVVCGLALALALSTLAFPVAARASENPKAVTPSIAVATGAVGALAPGRGAPSLELSAALALGHGPWSVAALFDGWTLDASGLSPPTTELVGAVGPSFKMQAIGGLSWTVAAAPAVAWSDAAVGPSSWHAGLVVAPGLELATRRRTLSLDLGGRAMFFTDGPRFALVAGASYSFR